MNGYLYQRGEVFWAIFTVDGVRYQKSTGTGNRRLAEDIAKKLREEIIAQQYGIVQVDKKLTLLELEQRLEKKHEFSFYQKDRMKQLNKLLGDVPIVKFSKPAVADYRRTRQAKSGITDSSLNHDVAVLKWLLFRAVEEGLLVSNPLSRVPMARARRVRRPVMTVLEEQALLAVMPAHLRAITITALDTGLRRGEILTERWCDVELARQLLYVSHSKTPEGEAREIPLTSRMQQLLAELSKTSELVFTYNGQRLQYIKRSWQTALKRAGLRHFRVHDLRHTFNSRLVEAGVLQEVRMELMGHSNHERVHGLYTHIQLPQKRQAILKLEAWVKEQEQQLIGGHNAS